MEAVGKDGIITVEDSKSIATTLESAEGVEIERGYESPYFVTNKDNETVEYHELKQK